MTVTSPPTSPSTPSRKRRSLRLSNVDIPAQEPTSTSSYTSGTTNGTAYSRRSSRTSQTSYQPRSPVTPRPMSSKSSRPPSFSQQRRLSRTSIHSNRSVEQLGDSGAGNLADELEQAWEGEGEEEEGQPNFLEGLREGDVGPDSSVRDLQSPYELNDMHDFGFGMVMQSPDGPQYDGQSSTLHVPQKTKNSTSRTNKRPGHQRHESAYDGSDYGVDSDMEDQDDLPPILRKRIRDIENLTRMCVNPEDAVSEGGGTIRRTIQELKDLGPQGNIEYGVTRLITAYTSMASHRTHKTRDLFSQSHSLMYGGTLNLPEEMIDLLLDEVNTLSSTLPFLRPQNPLLSLQILASQTDDLSQTLRSLTDLLQESRLAANAATRKLKSVRDMVEDMGLEEELVENSILLIQAGDWDRRCKTRQAAKTCQEVCEGFAARWGLSMDIDLTSPPESARQKPPPEVLVSV
ncbi:uncharacterized protein Z518_08845 [Rhinocladiella mackenziei CBS 650.93]|uniref:Rhinocladiella mackenziei CBS 650.93 unplaced genomic scaffold supercont1.6, whole genome shotgun sequence n=1 Tax=Rhinocladiella mackenziei CBS 650.93 TaxID=1442369 RepID=A0A0D2FLN5_9EURO|nr:uncharacterized protein Z518_08845 [Rhinocladiella mackenziei CBS 650.93]KIX02902.1 hypothetical protein Z518_08845 [Rhinocladiella mackenziei CBS 650.93]